MATIYFTSNADSGSGTLRAAISSASADDTIAPDPTVFATGPVVISLSSYLPAFPENATLDGGSIGIVLDGQNNSMSGYPAVRGIGTMTVINLTVKRYKVTTNAPVYLNNSSASHTYKRCKFVDNTGVWYGAVYILKGHMSFYDCLITGNKATGSSSTMGGLYVASNGTADFIRSTLCGNCNANVAGRSRITESGSFIGLTPPEIGGETPQEIGFVNPPPSESIPVADYTEGDWETWDFRLKPTSAYLTGAAYTPGELDLLGHPRTGSWGCYDGSWIVAGTATVSANTSADWLEVSSTGVLTLDGADRILTITRGASAASGATITSATRGYLVVPDTSEVASVTLTNVVACVSGAGASDLHATVAEITWNAVNSSIPVVLERQVAGAWTTIAQTAGTSYTVALSEGDYVRLFDGVQFLTTTAEAIDELTPAREMTEYISIGYLTTKYTEGALTVKTTTGYLN